MHNFSFLLYMLKLGETYMVLKYSNQPSEGFKSGMTIQGILLRAILGCASLRSTRKLLVIAKRLTLEVFSFEHI